MANIRIKPNERIASKHWAFDAYAQPFFHQGDATGCLVMHGFGGTPANMRVIADLLAQKGHTVYAPLLSGHGTTLRDMDRCTGDQWIDDAKRAYDRLVQAGCHQIYLIGLSMGGILMSLLAQSCPCAGLVLISTPFRMQEYLMKAMRFSAVVPFLPFRKRKESNVYAQLYGGVATRKLHDLYRLTQRARSGLYHITCPVLIIQSALDDKVDLKSVPIVEHGVMSNDIRTIWMEHSPHGCTYGPERDLVAQHCIDFIEEQQALQGTHHE